MSDDAPEDAQREPSQPDERPVRVFTGPVRRFFVARFCVASAFQIQGVAVGWYIYALTGSPLDLGLVGLVMFLPAASLALIAGQLIDRYSRRRVLLAAWTLQASSACGIALLALFGVGRVDLIYALIACFGAGRAFDQPAQAALLPSLVPVAIFPRVTPANSLVNQFAVIIGPALGGLLFAAGASLFGDGAPVAFFGTVFMYLIGLGAMVSLPHVPARPGQPLSWYSLLGGVRFIRRTEAVRGAITLDMFGVFFGGATALLPIFARDILMIGPVGLGLLRSATIAFGLSHWLALSVAALILIGAADVVSVVVRSTLVQTATPDAIRGRVSAVNSLFVGTSNQLGEFESGVTADWFGAVGSVVLGGAATLIVVAVASRRFPALRRMDKFIMAPAEAD